MVHRVQKGDMGPGTQGFTNNRILSGVDCTCKGKILVKINPSHIFGFPFDIFLAQLSGQFVKI